MVFQHPKGNDPDDLSSWSSKDLIIMRINAHIKERLMHFGTHSGSHRSSMADVWHVVSDLGQEGR